MLQFSKHLEWYLSYAATRKRNPVKPATLSSWKLCAQKWIIPSLGTLPVEEVNNRSVKGLVEQMATAGLSAQTISNYIGLVKLAIGAAVDENGEQLFVRRWNHEFLDMPVVQNQKCPTFTSETVSTIVRNTEGKYRMLFLLLGGTGMRVGEALGLELKHISSDCRTLKIEQSAWGSTIQSPKTTNAIREIDLCTEVAVALGEYLMTHDGGTLLFHSKLNKPMHQSNIARRRLHPILKQLSAPKTSFHAFRRFRVTHLRKMRVQSDCEKFWLGHAEETVTDGYSKIREDREYRQSEAERVGLGFSLS